MANKKIVITDVTKTKVAKIVKKAIPYVIGGTIAGIVGFVCYKKGIKVSENSYKNYLINFYKDPNNFNLIPIDNDAVKNGLLLVTGNVMKSEDDIVTFLSNRYHNGNPEPEVMNNIIESAKEIISLYHMN